MSTPPHRQVYASKRSTSSDIAALATDSCRSSVVCLSVGLSVCLSAGLVREPAKTAEPIEMSFGSCVGWTQGTMYSLGAHIPKGEGVCIKWTFQSVQRHLTQISRPALSFCVTIPDSRLLRHAHARHRKTTDTVAVAVPCSHQTVGSSAVNRNDIGVTVTSGWDCRRLTR